jgi:membrane protease subunit (stomatin/prohibitin family)
MTLGAVLIGIAVALVVVAYLARPFREERQSAGAQIEAWVAEARRASEEAPSSPAEPSAPTVEAAQPSPSTASDEVNFCPQCGRKVAPDHRFCPGCGYSLR